MPSELLVNFMPPSGLVTRENEVAVGEAECGRPERRYGITVVRTDGRNK